MGIRVANAPVAPAIKYNSVHLMAMRVTQDIYYNDDTYPKYRVEVEYRLFGVLEGQRFYEVGDVKRIIIDDFIPVAQNALMDGDPTLLMALGGIEQAVAAILSEQAGLDTSVT